jgi:hypothetical protein
MPPDAEPARFSRTAEDLIASLRRLPLESNPRTRRRATQEVSALVNELVVRHGIGIETPEHTIREHWVTIVGPANAAYSHPFQIDPKGRLIVVTSHAIVRNELFLHRSTITKKVQQLSGCSAVREIFLRSG